MTDLWLDAEDPDNAGKTVRVVEVKSGRLELTEIPRWGKQFKIENLYLDHPVVRFVKGKDGKGLIGFTDLVNNGAVKATTQANAATASAPAASGPAEAKGDEKGPRASDVFQIRILKIVDGEVDYDARVEGTEPLVLDGINSELQVSKDAETGWYGLAITAERKPIFSASMKGRINVDTLQLGMKQVALQLEVSGENKHYLPQVLQKVVEQYEVAGLLKVEGEGDVPMVDFSKGMLGLKVSLEKGNLTVGGFAMPVESLTSVVRLHDRLLEVNELNAKALGGTVAVTGVVPFDKGQLVRVNVHVEEVHLARTIKTFSKSNAKPMASGLVTGDIAFGAPVGEWKTGTRGAGKLKLSHGRVPELPVINEIVAEIEGLGKLKLKPKDTHDDEAMVRFEFDGGVVHVRELHVHADTLGLRGDGDVGMDGAAQFASECGAAGIGGVGFGVGGEIRGRVTDRVVGYRVTGYLWKPVVKLHAGPGW